ncbi:MAG TPA: FecR domain-containing protein, partial [Lacunisphaera sp.]|nr:FecR domain-containing protein [Lacunisphaera sp.]
MKISALFRFLFCAFVATGLSVAASAQESLGRIVAAKVQGPVQRIAADGTTTPLRNGDALTQKDSVATGKGASVVLVFENGSTVRIGAESRLEIETFTMDPLDQAIADFSSLKEEPSRSQTVLNLSYGEMVGEVKKLNTAGGSSYNVKTPVGAAGIRGTIYRVVFKPSADGKAFFTISTAEGVVVMENVTGTADIPVEAGKEVVVEIDTANPDRPA